MNDTLRGEFDSIRKKVLLYENPQIPPLRQNITLKITNPPGKRGAPRGHKDAKRVLGEPDEFINLSMEI